MVTIRNFFVIFVAVALHSHVRAEAALSQHPFTIIFISQAGHIDIPSVAASSVVLVNSSNTKVNISIRPKDGQWKNISINGGGNITYACDGCLTPYFDIVIVTEGVQVKYSLEPSQRYAIAFNNQIGAWDVYAVR